MIMHFRSLFLSLLIAHCSSLIAHGQELQPVRNNAFIPGEKFSFTVYYDSDLTGRITAGVATLEVSFRTQKIDDRVVYKVIGTGKSKGAFNLFFKVDDRFESYIDTTYMVPWYFVRRTREGTYKKDDEVRFNQLTGTASSRSANKKVPPGTQDFISFFFYARTVDMTGLRPGDYFPMNFYLDDSLYVSRVYFEGREIVKTEAGTFHCMKFKPMVATGSVFSQPYPMNIWVTDDQYRIPVLARSAVVVGSVKMELTGYQGLAGVPGALVGAGP
jgi:Protein of unknown function (DUF3108)